ncbi:MAG: ABC transporter permease [Bacteroidetes bacterium]|nr:MAG: ABC transporter permease [Bacteroidota bacterium]
MNLFKIAWRNLWRNKRRTLITAASLFFAVFFAIIMRSMALGTYDLMIDSAVRQYSGFIQIQNKEYWKEKTIDELMTNSDSLHRLIENQDGVVSLLPRLESFALASSGNKTKGIILQGINPLVDDKMTGLSSRLVKGKYLTEADNGVVLAQRLSSFLELNVGDTVVLLSQGYHGVTAANIFPVRGIVKVPNPTLDNRLIVTSIEAAQDFYGASNMLTSLVVNIESKYDIDKVMAKVKKQLEGSDLSVLSWTDMNKELKQQIDSDNGSGKIMLAILYMVVFFGVLGTIIMLTAERKKEFAVMVSIGMQRFRLSVLVFIETIFIGFLGMLAGLIAAMPILLYYANSPIRLTGEMAKTYETMGIEPLMGFSLQADIFINQFIIVFFVLIIALIYPTIKIWSFNLINALKS